MYLNCPISNLTKTHLDVLQLFQGYVSPERAISTLHRLSQSQGQSQSQSRSYFKTGCLQPISSSWRQAPSDSRPDTFPPSTEPLR
jgi:hypothetical protein